MNSQLTEKQIKERIRQEKTTGRHYKDNIDLTIDSVVELYEAKKIDEKTLRLVLSLTLSATTRETISDMTMQLLKTNLVGTHADESNKLLLVNYSKKSYA